MCFSFSYILVFIYIGDKMTKPKTMVDIIVKDKKKLHKIIEEQQKEINDLNKKLNNWRNISTLKLKKLVVLRERLDIANEFRAIVKELKRTK